jgi:hypothetical protein
MKSNDEVNIQYYLIDSITKCVNVVEEIILKESIISIDCEGVKLSKKGRLTLIQVILIFIRRSPCRITEFFFSIS